jgi:hypothetical protein
MNVAPLSLTSPPGQPPTASHMKVFHNTRNSEDLYSLHVLPYKASDFLGVYILSLWCIKTLESVNTKIAPLMAND